MNTKDMATALLRNAWKLRHSPVWKEIAKDDIRFALGVLGDLKLAVHKHKCGHTDDEEARLTGLSQRDGCGFEWSHDRREIKSDEQNEREHHCPRCGIGPWYLMLRERPKSA